MMHLLRVGSLYVRSEGIWVINLLWDMFMTPNVIWFFVIPWSLGCDITAKAEHLNPGGSVKDRAALYLIKEAEEKGMFMFTTGKI